MASETAPLDAEAFFSPQLTSTRRFASGRTFFAALLVAAAYWMTGSLGLWLPFPGAGVSALWMGNAILLSALLIARRRDWWLYLIFCLLAHLLLSLPVDWIAVALTLAMYTVNCAGALLGAFALLAVDPELRRIDRVRTAVALILIGGVLVPLSTSVLSSAVLMVLERPGTFWPTALTRTLTNSFGALTLVPLILNATQSLRGHNHSIRATRAAEGGLLAVSLVTLSTLDFIAPPIVTENTAALLYAQFSVLLWAAVRFGVVGSSASVLFLGVPAIFGLLNHFGPFIFQLPNQSALSLVLFLTLTSMTMLVLAVALEERRALERTSTASRARFRTIFESNIIPTMIWSSPGVIVDANPAFFELTGYRRSDLNAGTLFARNFMAPTSRLTGHPFPFSLDTDGAPIECELIVHSGRRIPVLTGGSHFPGSPNEGTAYVLDLSSLRKAESGRRQVEMLHSAVLASIHDQIAVLDESGDIIETNQSWRRFVEHPHSQAFERAQVGDAYLEICAAAAADGGTTAGDLLQCIRDVLAGLTVRRRLEYSHATHDGGLLWHEVSVEHLNRTEGGAIITRADVTAHKLAMSEAREQRAQLAHLGRAAILGELSGAFAHELAQPLTSILGNAEAALQLLQQGGNLGEIQEILRDIIKDDVRAAEIIGRLRSMLARGEIHREAVDLNQVVREVISLARSDLVTRNVVVALHLDPHNKLVQVDRVQMQQVVLNLLVNACEAMAEVPINERQLSVSTRTLEGDILECAVADRGRGISPEQSERIFQPFVTSKKQGMGLGLAICRSIVEAHGGRLWADTSVERGALFRFTAKTYA
jgi:PAS domain S-box-containing protein